MPYDETDYIHDRNEAEHREQQARDRVDEHLRSLTKCDRCLYDKGEHARWCADKATLEGARAKIKELEVALQWYADEDNYVAHQRLQYMAAPAEEDRGRRARRALGIK